MLPREPVQYVRAVANAQRYTDLGKPAVERAEDPREHIFCSGDDTNVDVTGTAAMQALQEQVEVVKTPQDVPGSQVQFAADIGQRQGAVAIVKQRFADGFAQLFKL